MKNARFLTVANSLLLLFVFFNVLKWMLAGRGVDYLSGLSSVSRYMFYALLVVSIMYSGFICYLLFSSKKSGIALIIFWDIFLGLFILVPWIGGYAMLEYSYGAHVDIGFFSVSNLLKGVLGVSLILFGLAFKRSKGSVSI